MDKQEELRRQIVQTFERRFATKNFDPNKKISDADWQTILMSARLSPSSFGYEPWHFLLIENQEIKSDLKEIAWGAVNSLNGTSHFMILLARKDVTADSDYVKYMTDDVLKHHYSYDSPRISSFRNFQKNDFDLNDSRSLFDWASKQTYIVLANMLTTAAFLGIDSCPIEGFNRQKVGAYLAKKGILDPNVYGVSLMAGFGYRDMEEPVKTRQPLSTIYEVIK